MDANFIAELWYKPWRGDGCVEYEVGSRADMLALAEAWRREYSPEYRVTVSAAPILQGDCHGVGNHRG